MSATDPMPAAPATTVAPTRAQRVRGNAVHLYTASGVLFAFAAAAEMCAREPDPRLVFAWLLGAGLVDAADGPLARAWHVKEWAPGTSGRTIDDIVDYLTFTFLPLLLVWRMEWVPEPTMLWVAPALIASLFGFANVAAKDEAGGFFLGFPSYWNLAALYLGLRPDLLDGWFNAAILLALAVLTVLPVRFIYPNLAPRPWKVPVLGGAFLWLALLAWMLPRYPDVPGWLVGVSLVYPLFYTVLSARLARRARQPRAT